MISCGLQSRAAYIFYFFALSKGIDIGVRGRGAVGSAAPSRLEIFQCKLLKNPECKTYIQYSEKFQGKLGFWGQAQSCSKLLSGEKMFNTQSIFDWGWSVKLGQIVIFRANIFRSPSKMPSRMPMVIDDAQYFLGYVLSTKFFLRIRFSSASGAHPSQEGYDKQKAVVV